MFADNRGTLYKIWNTIESWENWRIIEMQQDNTYAPVYVVIAFPERAS
jgi:hypothetical protein